MKIEKCLYRAKKSLSTELYFMLFIHKRNTLFRKISDAWCWNKRRSAVQSSV